MGYLLRDGVLIEVGSMVFFVMETILWWILDS